MDTRSRLLVTAARVLVISGMVLLTACPPVQRPGELPPLGLRAAVAIDAQHNQIVAGTFADEVQLGGRTLKSAGGTDVFVAKFNPKGELLWPPLRFGGLGNETVSAVAVSSKDGSIAFVGTFTHDLTIEMTAIRSTSPVGAPAGVFLAVLDPDGKLRWAQEIPGVDVATPVSVAVDPENGNIAVGGTVLAKAPGRDDKHPQIGMSITLTQVSAAGTPIGPPLILASSFLFTCKHSPCETGNPLFGLCDWCVQTICSNDSACCTNRWEQRCVDKVWTVCGQRCNCADFCTIGDRFNAYACTNTGHVCGNLPDCCRVAWTRDCLINANATCGTTCFIP